MLRTRVDLRCTAEGPCVLTPPRAVRSGLPMGIFTEHLQLSGREPPLEELVEEERQLIG